MDIIIYALISIFILFKLYTILGRNDNDTDFMQKFNEKINDNIIDLPVNKDVENEYNIEKLSYSKHSQVFTSINSFDNNFSEESFLRGAKKAFELVIKSFSNNDIEMLKLLLSEELYQQFINQLEESSKLNRFYDKTLVSLKSVEIIDATLNKTIASIKIKFISEQIDVVRNKDKEIIDGNPNHIKTIEDNWVLSRDVISSSPNWKVIKTNL
jgi:predicted lipid-binding transport protein (Tim44 family)